MAFDIGIGVPLSEVMVTYREYTISFNEMIREISEKGYTSTTILGYGATCADNRNNIVEKAKKLDVRKLLLTDHDMWFPKGAALKLLKHNVDIVSGLCVGKKPPYKIVAYKINKNGYYEPIGKIEENTLMDDLDGVGGAMLLIDMKVFDKIDKPYFHVSERLSNDIYFCRKAKEAGFKIHLDTGCQVGHLGAYPFTIANHYAYREATNGKN